MDTLIQLAVDYGLFLAKAVTVVVAIGVVFAWIASSVQQLKKMSQESLEVRNINDRLQRMADTLHHEMLGKTELKNLHKKLKAKAKQEAKAEKLGKKHRGNRLFVIDFDGDIKASAADNLREEINAILQVAESDDEVLIRLESPGGMVHSYGLAASQLRRLPDNGVKLTAAVDKLAASGGYLMACVADRIIAAPFAIIGSIGVVGQMPNFNRLLKEKNIDYEMHTAGDHKRTLTVFGENTDADRAKFREELEETHGLFKRFVSDNRPELDVDAVATGEHWYGSRALELKLVDSISTSDDYMLAAARDERQVFTVSYKTRPSLTDRVAQNAAVALRRHLPAWLPR